MTPRRTTSRNSRPTAGTTPPVVAVKVVDAFCSAVPAKGSLIALSVARGTSGTVGTRTTTTPVTNGVATFASLNFAVAGTSGHDTLTIDFSAGDPLPSGGAAFTGGSSSAGTDGISAAASRLSVNGATITLSTVGLGTLVPGTGTDAPTVAAGAVLSIAAPGGATGVSVQRFSAVTFWAGARPAVAAPAVHANRVLLVASGLSIVGSAGNWTGRLDLYGNDLDLPGGALATAADQVASGHAAGDWTGPGIDSGAAAAGPRHLTAMGAIQDMAGRHALYATFDGQQVTTTDVLVKFTSSGDTNLDGTVNAADYACTDAGLIGRPSGWLNGGFDYDFTVDGSDYTLAGNALN